MLDEDESFSISAFVTSPGYQRTVLKGYLVSRRPDGVYVAPIIPQLFYGASGTQLGASWRQNITTTGNQVILSRAAGGLPNVPKQQLYWRKVQDTKTVQTPTQTVKPLAIYVSPGLVILMVVGVIGAAGLYFLVKK